MRKQRTANSVDEAVAKAREARIKGLITRAKAAPAPAAVASYPLDPALVGVLEARAQAVLALTQQLEQARMLLTETANHTVVRTMLTHGLTGDPNEWGVQPTSDGQSAALVKKV